MICLPRASADAGSFHETDRYNGEIYNFRSLRGELERAGSGFGPFDTEVILAAYRVWG
jgi:asparagine synthetase B (glutamine-hydrolysing)